MSRTISFRATDSQEAGKRLEEALNADVSVSERLATDRMQEFGDVLGKLLELMPEGRQVVVSLTMHSGEEPDADGKERIRIKVATVTDRESGLKDRATKAEGGDLALEVSVGDEQHARQVAAEEQDRRNAARLKAEADAREAGKAPVGAGVQAGSVVSQG